jgi:hypothetical protein
MEGLQQYLKKAGAPVHYSENKMQPVHHAVTHVTSATAYLTGNVLLS